MDFNIERQTDVPLIFSGRKLADQTSREPTGDRSQRWQEIRIYRTDSGKYVTEVVGQSTLPGERVFRTVTVCNEASEVREALFRWKNNRRYLNDLAMDALEDAGETDSGLSTILAGEHI